MAKTERRETCTHMKNDRCRIFQAKVTEHYCMQCYAYKDKNLKEDKA